MKSVKARKVNEGLRPQLGLEFAHRGATLGCMCRHSSTGECPGISASRSAVAGIFLRAPPKASGIEGGTARRRPCAPIPAPPLHNLSA